MSYNSAFLDYMAREASLVQEIVHGPDNAVTALRRPPMYAVIDKPPAHTLLAGTRIEVAHGISTVHADMDFETYSEAGYVWDHEKEHWVGVSKSSRGLKAVGSAVYAEHPSSEVLFLSYNLKDGLGARLWHPGMPPPLDLFAHIAAGKLIEAHNSLFEYFIWRYVCTPRMGWPELPIHQLRCSMSKAAAFALPMGLEKLAIALNTQARKDAVGAAMMRKITCPRIPTRANKALRYTAIQNPEEFKIVGAYCVQDTYTESEVSSMLPDLQPQELTLWLLDQTINARGAPVDSAALQDCIAIINQASAKYTEELRRLTGDECQTASEIAKLSAWLTSRKVTVSSLDSDHVDALLLRTDLPPDCRRVLEIRASLGASSVKKLFSLQRYSGSDSRVRGLFSYCGADRTGRFAGRGPQPQNFPSSGPSLQRCDKIGGCGHHYGGSLLWCPWCGADVGFSEPNIEWNPTAMKQALKVIASRNLFYVEHYFGDAVAIVSACLRGLFCAGEGMEFICSDFSAIEAVVAGELSGETWRQEVFRTHGKIYEMSASKISGVPFEEIINHKKRTGDHHPLRKKIGKVAELASGYAGWIGAWKNFGADKFLNDDEIKEAILAWRAASPMIVEMWGGQWRNKFDPNFFDGGVFYQTTQEYFGLEGAAIQAVLTPGQAYKYRDISYMMHLDVLYCCLPSGRLLSYHAPRLYASVNRFNKREQWSLSYMGQDSVGNWVRLETYGGKLFENVVQAVARDVLTHSMVALESAGYSIVLHVHDEIVSEVRAETGSIEEFERIMSTMPNWAAGWPIKAAGGWRGKRYRKE